MTIALQDITFNESQVMDNVPEGGGASTGNVIVDGKMNNIFADVSDLDRINGAFALMKFFARVGSLNTDLFGGAKTVITAIPEDLALAYTIFSTGDAFDRRADAQAHVEAYQHKSVQYHGLLMGNHVAGQGMIEIYQRLNTALPQPGQTLALVHQEGQPGQREQYVRVRRVSSEERQFYDAATQTDYTALVVRCELQGQLQYAFPGSEPDRSFTGAAGATIIRTTNVVDAARYYGGVKTKLAAAIGDMGVTAESIFTQLVPAAQSSSQVIDVQAGGTSTDSLSGGTRDVEITQVSHTDVIRITELNADLNHTMTLRPLPGPGTLVIEYISQGQRYTIRDVGNGTLSGDGAGTVNYATGSVGVTLLAIPDVNTVILYKWGTGAHFQQRTIADITLPEWYFQTAYKGLEPGTIKIRWQVDGIDKLVTDDGNGNLIGDGTGKVNYARGEMYMRPSELPEANAMPQLTYDYGAVESMDFHPQSDGNGFVEIHIPGAVKPRMTTLEWETIRRLTETEKTVN